MAVEFRVSECVLQIILDGALLLREKEDVKLVIGPGA
jgi:hypothetical protein